VCSATACLIVCFVFLLFYRGAGEIGMSSIQIARKGRLIVVLLFAVTPQCPIVAVVFLNSVIVFLLFF